MLFNHEYQKRLRVGFIGAGEHSFRNILPCFQYLPIELVAMADHHPERGLPIARQFGAKRFYPNHEALLAKEAGNLDAVLIVVGPDAEGKPRYPALAAEALKAGFHVWIEKPPCSHSSEIRIFTEACWHRQQHRYIATGMKKMFVPAYLKVAELVADPDFGVSSFALRYPLTMPPEEQRKDPKAMYKFLDFVHPYSILTRLFGECEGFTYMRSKMGDVVMNLRYRSGIVGALHLTGGQAATSPLERLEVIGTDANVVVENGVRLIYYRPNGNRGEGGYGRATTFIGDDSTAPIIWEPEFSLGQLYNKQLFLEGYVGCLQHFCDKLLADEPPRHGNLVDMLHIMTIYTRLIEGKENTWIPQY